MKKTFFLTLCCLAMLGACQKKNSDNAANVDTGMSIRYRDSLGNDLLDSSQLHAFHRSDIRHYYLDASSVKTEVNVSNLDYPHQFNIQADTDGVHKVLWIYPYISYISSSGTFTFTDIVELSPSVSDTIRTEVSIDRLVGLTQTKKVWYNNVLVWAGTSARTFTIQK